MRNMPARSPTRAPSRTLLRFSDLPQRLRLGEVPMRGLYLEPQDSEAGGVGTPRSFAFGPDQSWQNVHVQIRRASLIEILPRNRGHGGVVGAKFWWSNQ